MNDRIVAEDSRVRNGLGAIVGGCIVADECDECK